MLPVNLERISQRALTTCHYFLLAFAEIDEAILLPLVACPIDKAVHAPPSFAVHEWAVKLRHDRLGNLIDRVKSTAQLSKASTKVC